MAFDLVAGGYVHVYSTTPNYENQICLHLLFLNCYESIGVSFLVVVVVVSVKEHVGAVSILPHMMMMMICTRYCEDSISATLIFQYFIISHVSLVVRCTMQCTAKCMHL